MKILLLILPLFVLGACQPQEPDFDTLQVVENLVIGPSSVPIFPRKAALTTDTARRFSLELPRRCRVDWDNQNVLSILPEEDITMVRVDGGDPLPNYNVSDFKFERKTISEVLGVLLEGTGIHIIELQEVPDLISGEIKSGNLSDAVELLAKMARSYYRFNATANELHITPYAKWLVRMPDSDMVIMAMIDALHGAELRSVITNWRDRTLAFEGNHQTEREVRRVVSDVGSRNFLIAYDMDIYRVYPRTENPIVWMNMLPAMGQNNIRMSIPGVMGRALVVSPEINTKTLQAFLAQQANLVLISQGSFVIPNGWSSRFDIGQCTREDRLETDLIVGARGKFGDYAGMKKVDSRLVLRTHQGEVVNFSIPTDLGDNIVIIGIPTHAFVEDPITTISPFAELVVFISPRVIQVVERDGRSDGFTPLSGDRLRDFLAE